MGSWSAIERGVLTLPSGRRVRGRGLRNEFFAGEVPEFGVYLLAKDPRPFDWPADWIKWRDFGLPADRATAAASLADALRRCGDERVELACDGGHGRTGTALACLAVLDGIPAADAVRFVRAGYDPSAVETPGQHRFVARFARDHEQSGG